MNLVQFFIGVYFYPVPVKSAIQSIGERGIYLLKRTISVMVGKGSVNHNSRKFHAKNIDPEKSSLNAEYCNQNIKDIYQELFDEALARYNEKQKRSDTALTY